jgi:hypothetical protein
MERTRELHASTVASKRPPTVDAIPLIAGQMTKPLVRPRTRCLLLLMRAQLSSHEATVDMMSPIMLVALNWFISSLLIPYKR